jgi:4-amino-4-deoxy-L-arabinose transferase-like glycosyltransferase
VNSFHGFFYGKEFQTYIRASLNRNQKIQLIIAFGALVLFIPFLGVVHLFDWDEINFAEAAREMIVTGNYSMVQIDFQPFWEKPPLFFWMQAISMKIFGVNEFAARFPNAICGLFTLLALFRVGSKVFNEKLAIWWVLVYAGSFLPHFYFKSGIIDPWFNLFIFLGIAHAIYIVQERHKPQLQNAILSGLFIGLAIMTKGPVALLIFLMTYGIYLLIRRFKSSMVSPKQLVIFLGSMLAVGGMWFAIEYLNGRGYIIKDFIVYQIRLLQTQDAGHGGPFYYHFIVLLIGCFPASIFAFKVFLKRYDKHSKEGIFILWMKILFWAVLILFSLVRTKIVHYSSMCYFPLTFLGALGITEMLRESKNNKAILSFTAVISIIFSTLVIALPFIDSNKEWIISKDWIKDPFAVANLRADVLWQGWEFLIGVVGLIALVYFLLRFNSNRRRALYALLAANVLVLNLVAVIYLPKIEQYSQGAAIEFYESKQNEDCYITTIGFKSYADMYYARKKPTSDPSHDDVWLLNAEVKKPVYVVSKITKKEKIRLHYPMLELIGEKNGFTFYKRVD